MTTPQPVNDERFDQDDDSPGPHMSERHRPASAVDLEPAKRVVETEREEVRAEIDAFETFLTRLDAVSTATPRPSQSPPNATVAVATQSSRDTGFASLRTAYEETVMKVPHYDDVYGDSYRESSAEEFGAELAVALDSQRTLTSALKHQLQTAAREAKTDRERFLKALDAEAAVLEETEDRVAAIRDELTRIRARPFYECPGDELRRLNGDLEHLQTQADRLVSDRQNELQHQHRTLVLSADIPHLATYLYRELPVTSPVLSVVATGGRRIDETSTQIETSLAVSPHDASGHGSERS